MQVATGNQLIGSLESVRVFYDTNLIIVGDQSRIYTIIWNPLLSSLALKKSYSGSPYEREGLTANLKFFTSSESKELFIMGIGHIFERVWYKQPDDKVSIVNKFGSDVGICRKQNNYSGEGFRPWEDRGELWQDSHGPLYEEMSSNRYICYSGTRDMIMWDFDLCDRPTIDNPEYIISETNSFLHCDKATFGSILCMKC